ncbi:hypothetical protein QIS99_13440 [Streptomyces sp. B-S-A8]|uniref:Large membrane protein n=1 Tax=Streptomyces solicavernae TaxID=3043614 RepID=A0ABT6RRY1_9ACTN|nr:hypothetical protein [Streptomyces sp. B-S-A8]MDI3387196.1 hypothetical protein [Streptomyces sp. B-S-A8]
MGSEETHEGTRRRRPGIVAVSVAAAVLLAGGGGAYVAANASGGSGSGVPAADETPPPLTLDDPAGIAPGEPAPGGVTYRAGGELPKGPGSASVHRLRGTVDADQVARLAEALDVSGTPRAEGTTWKVGRAGDGPLLTVGKEAPGTWTFQAYAGGTDNCVKGKSCAPKGGSGTGDTGPGAETDPAGDTDPGPVSERAAKSAAAPVLKAVGQAGAALDASQTMGAVRVVNADPKVSGLPTYGWSTGVQIGSDGQVVGGSGKLTKPVKGAAYPVLSAEKTIAELNEAAAKTGPGSGSGGCARPVPHTEGASDAPGPGGIAPGEPAPGGGAGPRQPCPPESGAKGAGPEPVEVAKATFGLALHFERGRPVLVPSWLFQVRPEGAERPFTVTHPAVDPQYLTGASAPEPAPTQDAGPESRDVPVTSYSADGRKLTLHFWGGACSEYTARATESASEVRVAVAEKPQKKGEVCVMIAEERTAEVTLDKPLGERTVVGTDGVAVRRK